MSKADFNTHREALLRAHKEVSDPNNKTDWALFTYEGKTNTIKVSETGDGGIEEMVDELSGGKIMYAYCSVKDPNTGLPKMVLINWQPEGVPEMRKGACANHTLDVSKFFRGAHVTINARTEDDVDADEITDKVSKSSGSNYSVHKEQRKPGSDAPQGPVGSVYQRTRADNEIKHSSRGKFWDSLAGEQKTSQAEQQQKIVEEKRRLDEETKDRESRESKQRDQRENERMKKVDAMKETERQANELDKEAEKKRWEDQQQQSLKDEEERRLRSERMRKERAAEARSLVSQRSQESKTAFDDKPRSQFDGEDTTVTGRPAPPRRQLKHGFMAEQESSPSDMPRKQPIKLPSEPAPEPPSPSARYRPPECAPPASQPPAEPVQTSHAPAKPTRHFSRSSDEGDITPQPSAVRTPSPQPVSSPSSETSVPQTRNLLKEGLPPRQGSDDEEEEGDWEEETPSQPAVVKSPVTPEEEDLYEDTGSMPIRHTAPDTQDNEPYTQQSEVIESPGDDKGVIARALYDYQASEENEITFDPEDLITNIEQIDDGWWIGVAPDGSQGMFPANYVEII